MVIIRKIELRIIDKNNLSTIKKWSNLMPRLHNQIVTNIFLNDVIIDKFVLHTNEKNSKIKELDMKITTEFDKLKGEKDKGIREKGMEIIEKLKKNKSKFNVEAKKEFDKLFKDVYGKSFDSTPYEVVRNDELLKELPSKIVSDALNNLGFYKKDIWKIKNGEERIRMYSKGMPIPASKQSFSISEVDDSDLMKLRWFQGIEFELFFGRDKSDNRTIVNRILSSTYKLCDSSIQLKKDKVFLNLCVDIPVKSNKLDTNTVVGVDLGLSIPAYCGVNNSQDRLSIGSFDDFVRIRNQFQSRRRSIQSSIVTAKGGHGRGRKLKAMDNLENKERNWVKTYNHKVSKAIIEFAIKNRAGQINLEFLKGYGNRETNDFVLRNWSYFELQQFIEYKAKMNGIEVVYIDPYHTSQTCSCCGNYEKGQRKSQSKFVCAKCGEELNADYNASKNISISNKYVTSKSQCEYYNKK